MLLGRLLLLLLLRLLVLVRLLLLHGLLSDWRSLRRLAVNAVALVGSLGLGGVPVQSVVAQNALHVVTADMLAVKPRLTDARAIAQVVALVLRETRVVRVVVTLSHDDGSLGMKNFYERGPNATTTMQNNQGQIQHNAHGTFNWKKSEG